MKEKNNLNKSILRSNKGFSLIELIVVIAIMAVAVGLVTITYTIVHNANVAKAANMLDTAFNKARIQSMAKGADAGQLTVWIQGGVMYYTIGDPATETPTAVNSAVIDISYSENGTSWVGPGVDMPQVVYRFNSAGMVIQSGGYLPREFMFSHGNRRVAVIFFLETGKHMTELQ